MPRLKHNEFDCTNALGVPFVYDRITELGVPYDNPNWKAWGAEEFYHQLVALGKYLWKCGFLHDGIKSILTGGLYVNKPGAHGKGIACDFDGFTTSGNRSYIYKQDVFKEVGDTIVNSMHPKQAVRIVAAINLFFGICLTWGYNSRHGDHPHFDMGKPVGWRNSRSQVVVLQEMLVHYFGDTKLKIDGKLGEKTMASWQNNMKIEGNYTASELWIDTLKVVSKNDAKAYGKPL